MHKVLPSLSMPGKSVVRFTDSLGMAMTADWDFMQSLLPKDNLFKNIFVSLQLVIGTVWRR